VSDDQCGTVGKTFLPRILGREIGLDYAYARMGDSEDRGVRRVFVDTGDRAKAAAQKARHQILADQTGGAGDDDAFLWHGDFAGARVIPVHAARANMTTAAIVNAATADFEYGSASGSL
jgi:hypothetical protein